jgi:alanine-synthesizing transaminase
MPHDGEVTAPRAQRWFSARLPWSSPENTLAALTRARKARGDLVDLTESNPTSVGLGYPDERLRAALAPASSGRYEPSPLGLPVARAAVAAEYARAGVAADPDRVVITASSSESCSFLFKLLCDPGDAVLVPEPSYPLYDYLARLDGVVPIRYRLAFDGSWHIDFASLTAALAAGGARGGRPRAVVVVNPNNPTGSFLERDDLARLAGTAAHAGLAVIADEVFASYAFTADVNRVTAVAAAPELADAAPAFSLGGLSKSCGLPQVKLGWILVGGHDPAASLAGLELVADSYLSVGTPVQQALPELFALGADVRAAITARVTANRAQLAAALTSVPGCTLLPAQAGWSAIVRLPAIRSDEAWAAGLVADAGVLVHPGYFFDLTGGTFVVVSLLPEPRLFAEGVRRLTSHLGT